MLQTVNSWTSLTNGLESVSIFYIQGLHVLLRDFYPGWCTAGLSPSAPGQTLTEVH